ncbi:hypothetical protein [Mesorhizobium sp. M1396]|uniref:dCTP deaminase n=1 Tax=Mesorhizobium sp. M1396 TaxID=2957095 RepID=UPI0033368597
MRIRTMAHFSAVALMLALATPCLAQQTFGGNDCTVELTSHSRIAARVEGKSSMARLGIGVHLTAPTIHAGFAGQIRLEMVNHNTIPVKLKPGMRICQLILNRPWGRLSVATKAGLRDRRLAQGRLTQPQGECLAPQGRPF